MKKKDKEKDIKLSEIPIVENIADGKAELVDSKAKPQDKELSFTEWTIEAIKSLGKNEKWSEEDITEASVEEDDEARGFIRVSVVKQDWLIFRTFEFAEAYAIAQVKEDLETEPFSLFETNWLKNFIYISEVDIDQIASEESNNRWEESVKKDNEELKKIAKKNDLETDFSKYIDEEEIEPEEEKNLKYKSEDELMEKLGELFREDFETQMKEKLKDPIQYFVKEEGLYSESELFNLPFIKIDVEKASKDAVDSDGVDHFLAGYDSKQVELEDNIGYAYRQN